MGPKGSEGREAPVDRIHNQLPFSQCIRCLLITLHQIFAYPRPRREVPSAADVALAIAAAFPAAEAALVALVPFRQRCELRP